jgi:hypothetical protein
MLLFLADEPTHQNEKDGMSQRVKWIDEQFRDAQRVILRISPKGFFRRKRYVRSKYLTAEMVNLFIHMPRILSLALRSEAIYVHSCHNALRGLPLYFLRLPIVTDLHGVVPEEAKMSGSAWKSRIFSAVEKIVARRSQSLVFVSDAMRRHFLRKYASSHPCRSYIIPILPREPSPVQGSDRDPRLVIYAGGLQAWQRIDQMLDAVSRAGEFRYLFLTGNKDAMLSKLRERGIDNVEIDSVPRAAMPEYYARASFGFALREDSVVNRVACPTKLVEYMWSGVIPIVEQPFIGDFQSYGFKYILVADFVRRNLPGPAELNRMRQHNRAIACAMSESGDDQLRSLKMQMLKCASDGDKTRLVT